MKKEQAIHTSNKQYLKTAVEEAEEFNPDVKVGTIIQAYGFPMFSGLKGENFYKVVSIDGNRVTFRRTNETGDLGNMGLQTYTADIRAIKDAIESVEVGGGTSGLKIWSQPGEGLEESVNEEKVYIDFLNKKKGFKKDRMKFNSYQDAVKWARKNFDKFNPDMIKYESVNEVANADIIKDLDKVKTDLLKKVDVLIAKKKKLYSNVDITTPMSSDEKQLDKDIQSIFSQIQSLIQQKRKIKTESVNEVKYPTDLKVGSVIMGQGFTMLKGIKGGKYYKVVAIDDISATLVPSDKNGNQKGSSKVRHKLDSIEGGIRAAKRSDENGIVVIKESVNEARGAKMIQKDYDKVIGEIETTLESYKKAKGTPKAASFVAKLKALNDKKKSLEKELEDKVSGLYKDAELKMESKKLETLRNIIREEVKKSINESTYMVYHKSYTSAVDAALNYVHGKGFTYDKEETATKIGFGPKKPSEGKTNRFSIDLYRYGKMEKNKKLHIQIYNRGNELDAPYELNCYIG